MLTLNRFCSRKATDQTKEEAERQKQEEERRNHRIDFLRQNNFDLTQQLTSEFKKYTSLQEAVVKLQTENHDLQVKLQQAEEAIRDLKLLEQSTQQSKTACMEEIGRMKASYEELSYKYDESVKKIEDLKSKYKAATKQSDSMMNVKHREVSEKFLKYKID